MDAPELDESAYATKVEEAFIAERGTPFLLSPKDWALIRGWREAGVPVNTVVRALRETFEKRRARGQAGKISSIAYCAGAVEELWEMERRGLVGKSRETPEAGANAPAKEEILALLARRLRDMSETLAELRAPLLAAASKIEVLSRDLSLEEIETELSGIESSLVRSALRRLSPEQTAFIEARVAEALGDVAGLPGHVVERMRRALTRREVRALLGLPPLTLLHG